MQPPVPHRIVPSIFLSPRTTPTRYAYSVIFQRPTHLT
jgi:hypothetical protein